VYANGDIYEGQWKEGKMDGEGKSTYTDGNVHEGQWKDGKQDGQGKITFADGNVYEVQWKKGILIRKEKLVRRTAAAAVLDAKEQETADGRMLDHLTSWLYKLAGDTSNSLEAKRIRREKHRQSRESRFYFGVICLGLGSWWYFVSVGTNTEAEERARRQQKPKKKQASKGNTRNDTVEGRVSFLNQNRSCPLDQRVPRSGR
jgi:hypothetical protein